MIGFFSSVFQGKTIEFGLTWYLLTFALGIQTTLQFSGCSLLNFLSIQTRLGSLLLLQPASSSSQSFPFLFHAKQLFLLIIPASSNYQQYMPQATLITEISRTLRNQLGGPLRLLICKLCSLLRLTPLPPCLCFAPTGPQLLHSPALFDGAIKQGPCKLGLL